MFMNSEKNRNENVENNWKFNNKKKQNQNPICVYEENKQEYRKSTAIC